MRLFLAVDFPDPARRALAEVLTALRPDLPAARWVSPETFHLTLSFLGETASGLVPALSRAMREKLEQEGGFRTHFGPLGAFPNSGPIRVAWIALEPSVRFLRLAERVSDGIRSAGVGFDDKPFRSHVTLARCDPPWPAATRGDLRERSAEVGQRLAGVDFACDRVTLFSSTLGEGPVVHRVEESFPLSPP